MKFTSLQPFVPSGSNFERSKELFQALGFVINWDAGDYISFQKDDCKFILQKYNNETFAENFMINIGVDDVDAFWNEVNEKQLVQKFGIRLGKPADQPYGREVNIIDIAAGMLALCTTVKQDYAYKKNKTHQH